MLGTSNQWTTVAPTKEGLYWAKPVPGKTETDDIQIVELWKLDNISGVAGMGSEKGYQVEHFTHWLGPLPEPVKPGT